MSIRKIIRYIISTLHPSNAFLTSNVSDNNSKTYVVNSEDDDDMSIISNEVTNGLRVYLAKTNDTRKWVTIDLTDWF